MTQLTWDTATELDASQSESRVYHESVAGTGHGDAAQLGKGPSYTDPGTTFAVASASIVAYYPFQEASGTTVTDVEGTDDGTYNAATLQEESFLGVGQAGFDGTSNNYATYPAPFTASGAQFSLSMWMYWDTITSDADDTFLASGSTNTEPLLLEHDSSNVWRATVNNTSGTSYQIQTTDLMNTGEWIHLAVTYNRNDQAVLYLNGTSRDSAAVADADFEDAEAGETVTVAADVATAENSDFKTADHVWWNTELSSAQVSTVYDLYTAQGSYTSSAKTA